MSETSTSLLIAAGILFVLTLSDPIINKLFAMLRRTARKKTTADDSEVAPQPVPSYERDAA